MKQGTNDRYAVIGKRFSLLAATFLFILLLAACSASVDDQPQPSETAVGTSETGGAAEAEQEKANEEVSEEASGTREYVHMAGSSEIPLKPQRVVTDWYYGQLVALGVKPVGTDNYVWNNHPFIEQAGTESIGQSMEKIIELEPDLIISWGAGRYDDFSKIAPTIPLELSGGPKEAVRIFGDILGRTDEAEQWVKDFDQKAEEYRQQIADKIDPEETFTIFNVWKDTMRVYGYVNMGGYALYEVLQMQAPEKVKEAFENSSEWYAEISLEAVMDYAGDHIILTSYDPEGTSTMMQQLEKSGWWNALDAVKNDRVYSIDYNTLYFDDPIAIENQVKVLAEVIAGGR